MEKLKQKLREFAEVRDWAQFHSPKNLAMALSVEASELLEHFQWLTQDESRSLTLEKKEQVKQEIGDVLNYLVFLSDKLGIDPIEAAHDKIRINEKKYPVEKAKGCSLKYNEL